MNSNEDVTYIGARDGICEFTKTSNIVPLTGKLEGYGHYKDGGYFKRDDLGKWHIISELPKDKEKRLKLYEKLISYVYDDD